MHINPIGLWGRYREFLAKIGTHSSTTVLIKRFRRFHLDQIIEFCEVRDLAGRAKGMAPDWQRGRIWKIDDTNGMLFIEKM